MEKGLCQFDCPQPALKILIFFDDFPAGLLPCPLPLLLRVPPWDACPVPMATTPSVAQPLLPHLLALSPPCRSRFLTGFGQEGQSWRGGGGASRRWLSASRSVATDCTSPERHLLRGQGGSLLGSGTRATGSGTWPCYLCSEELSRVFWIQNWKRTHKLKAAWRAFRTGAEWGRGPSEF